MAREHRTISAIAGLAAFSLRGRLSEDLEASDAA